MSRRGWWRTNAAALGVLALVAPATVVVVGGYEWWEYYYLGTPVFATDASDDGTIDYAGGTFGPARAEIVDPEQRPDLDVPAAGRMVVVTIPVAAGDTTECTSPVLRETSTDRTWVDSSAQTRWPYDSTTSSSCSWDGAGTYELRVPYLIPDDAEGPFSVEFFAVSDLPAYARLVVDP